MTSLIQGRDVAVATAPLAVGLGIVRVEVIAAGEGTVAARNPADMRLLFRVAFHVALEMFLALETSLATGLLALELHLLDDGRQVLKTEVRTKELLLGRFARRLAVTLHHAFAVDWRELELFLIVIVSRHSTNRGI